MQFANPFYFFLAILIAFVILLYFFRKQYHAIINPSNLLWKQVMNEWQASPWLKKLQQNLIFWLQIIALTFLMLALVKPFWNAEKVKGEHLIWIVDTSASMSAVKDKQTILNASKTSMLEMVDRLNGQNVTIINAGIKPVILLNSETDKTVIRKKIKELEVTYEHENIEKAVRLADSLSANLDAAVHIFSDGVKKNALGTTKGKADYEIHNFRVTNDNISLLSFGVAENNHRISGLAVIENQGDKPKSVLFQVKNDDTILFKKNLKIPAGERLAIEIPALPEVRFYQAAINAKDAYAADNELTGVYTEMNPAVYALGEVNPFFIKGLETIGIPAIQLERKNAADMKESGIILAEGIALNELPRLPAIYINKPKDPKARIELKDPILCTPSPLTEFVEMEKTYIKYAYPPVNGKYKNLVVSGEHPLVQTGMRGGQPVILLNFSLENTDWPLHPGFPIFLYNSYQWLTKQTGFLGYFQPGEEKWLQLDNKNGLLEVFNEAGESLTSFHLDKENFRAPNKPGIYQAVTDGKINYFSVLLDDREKKLNRNPSFSINHAKAQEQIKTEGKNDAVWFGLSLIVFLVLLLEWEVYRRGFRG